MPFWFNSHLCYCNNNY